MKKLAFAGLLGFAQAADTHDNDVGSGKIVTGQSEWGVTTEHASSTADSDLYQVEVVHTRGANAPIGCEQITNTLTLDPGQSNEITGTTTMVAWEGDCGTEGTHGLEFASGKLPGAGKLGKVFATKFCVKAERTPNNYGKLAVKIGLTTNFKTGTHDASCSAPVGQEQTVFSDKQGEVAATFKLDLTDSMVLESLEGETKGEGIAPVPKLMDTGLDKQTAADVGFSRTFAWSDKSVQSGTYIVDDSTTVARNTYTATMSMHTKPLYDKYKGQDKATVGITCRYKEVVANQVHIECTKDDGDKFMLPFNHAKMAYFGASDDCLSGLCTGAVSVNTDAEWSGSGITEFADTKHKCVTYDFVPGSPYEIPIGDEAVLSDIYDITSDSTPLCTLDETKTFTPPSGTTGCSAETWIVGEEDLDYEKSLYNACKVVAPSPTNYDTDGNTITIGLVESAPFWNKYTKFGFTGSEDTDMLISYDGEPSSIPREASGSTRFCGFSSTNGDQDTVDAIDAAVTALQDGTTMTAIAPVVDPTYEMVAGQAKNTDGTAFESRCNDAPVDFEIACKLTDVVADRNSTLNDGEPDFVYAKQTATANATGQDFAVTEGAHVYVTDGTAHTTSSTEYALNGETASSNRTIAATYDLVDIQETLLILPQTTSTAETFNCVTGITREYTQTFILPCDTHTVKHTTTTYVRHTAAELEVQATITNPTVNETSEYANPDPDGKNTAIRKVTFTSEAIVADTETSLTATAKATEDGVDSSVSAVVSGCEYKTNRYECDLTLNNKLDNLESDKTLDIQFTVQYGHHATDADCASNILSAPDVGNKGATPTITFVKEEDKFGGKIEIRKDGVLLTEFNTDFDNQISTAQILDTSLIIKVDADAEDKPSFTVRFYRHTPDVDKSCNPIITIPSGLIGTDCSAVDKNQCTALGVTTDGVTVDSIEMPNGWDFYYVTLKVSDSNPLRQDLEVGYELDRFKLKFADCDPTQREVDIVFEMGNPASLPRYQIKGTKSSVFADFTAIDTEIELQSTELTTDDYTSWNTVTLALQHFTDKSVTAESKDFELKHGDCESVHFTTNNAIASAGKDDPAVVEWYTTAGCVNYGTIAVRFDQKCAKFKVACQRHATEHDIITADLDYQFVFKTDELKVEPSNNANDRSFGGTCSASGDVGGFKDGCSWDGTALDSLVDITQKFKACGATPDNTDTTKTVYAMNLVQSISNDDHAGVDFCSSTPLKLSVQHSGNSTAYMTIKGDDGFQFDFSLKDFGYEICTDDTTDDGHRLFFEIEDGKTVEEVYGLMVGINNTNKTVVSETKESDFTAAPHRYHTECKKDTDAAAEDYCVDENALAFEFIAKEAVRGQNFFAAITGSLSIKGNPCLDDENEALNAVLQIGNGGALAAGDLGNCKTDTELWEDVDGVLVARGDKWTDAVGTASVEVEVDELGCFRLIRGDKAVGKLDMTGYDLKECTDTFDNCDVTYTDLDKAKFITPSLSTATLDEDTEHYFRMGNLRDLSDKNLGLTVRWTYIDIGGSRRLRHETYFLGSGLSVNPHATGGMKILPASVQVAEQLETAGMSSDIAAGETTSETTDETDTAPAPELATESTAATTSVGVWVGVGVGSLAVVMLVVVYVQRANQVGIAGGPATGSTKYRGYKKVDSLRFSSNIAF